MSPNKVDRTKLARLTDLPNVGQAMAGDLRLVGIHEPQQLTGRCPLEMYDQLCQKTGHRHDPCVIDVFMSVTRFMSGDIPRPWWEYTHERKRMFSKAQQNEAPPRRDQDGW